MDITLSRLCHPLLLKSGLRSDSVRVLKVRFWAELTVSTWIQFHLCLRVIVLRPYSVMPLLSPPCVFVLTAADRGVLSARCVLFVVTSSADA